LKVSEDFLSSFARGEELHGQRGNHALIKTMTEICQPYLPLGDMLLLPIRPALHRAINALEALYELTIWPRTAQWEGDALAIGRAEFLPEELLELWTGSRPQGVVEAWSDS